MPCLTGGVQEPVQTGPQTLLIRYSGILQAGWLPAGSWSTDTMETDTHYRPPQPGPRSWLLILATHCAGSDHERLPLGGGIWVAFFPTPPSPIPSRRTQSPPPKARGDPAFPKGPRPWTCSGTPQAQGTWVGMPRGERGSACKAHPLPSLHLASSRAPSDIPPLPGCPSLHPAIPTCSQPPQGCLWPPSRPPIRIHCDECFVGLFCPPPRLSLGMEGGIPCPQSRGPQGSWGKI